MIYRAESPIVFQNAYNPLIVLENRAFLFVVLENHAIMHDAKIIILENRKISRMIVFCFGKLRKIATVRISSRGKIHF